VDQANYEEACLFKSVIDSVIDFHIKREADGGMGHNMATFLQSLTMLADERVRSKKAFTPRKVMAAEWGSFKKGKEETGDAENPSSPTSKRSALQDMKINRQSMTRAELSSNSDLSASAGMMQYLAKQLSCKVVLLATVKADGTISYDDILSTSPEGVPTTDGFDACVKSKAPMGVQENGASLVVPIKSGDGDVVIGVVQCINKVSITSGRSGIPFTKSDTTVAEVCGAIALAEKAKSPA